VKAGKARAIAVTGSHRDPSLPDMPTFAEAGLPDADVTSVRGLHAVLGQPLGDIGVAPAVNLKE
jgi:tripartite-type tricarboxylate transporter receptor subunit TctC